MNQNFYFSFVLVVSAFVFVNRISAFFIGKLPLSKKLMTKIGTFYFLFSFAVLFLFFETPFYLFALLFLANILCPICFFIYKKMLQRQFQSEFVRFSSVVILKMKMGDGFRSSFRATLDLSKWKFRALLSELLDNVAFSQQKTPQIRDKTDDFMVYLLGILKQLDGNPGTALMQLIELRNFLQKQSKFRRRSGQIWGQIGVQAVTIGGLYLLLMLYMVGNFNLLEHIYLLFTSLAFFVCGLLLLFKMRKVNLWKL